MQETLNFGKFAIEGEEKVNEIEVELRYEKNGGKPKFSAMGTIWNANHTEMLQGGQCQDTINDYICHSDLPREEVELWKTVYGLWKRNHLNDIDASANDAQREAVEEYRRNHDGKYDYDGVCEYLREKGIYYVYVNGKKCGYGEEWYYREIPFRDRRMIERIFNGEHPLDNAD